MIGRLGLFAAALLVALLAAEGALSLAGGRSLCDLLPEARGAAGAAGSAAAVMGSRAPAPDGGAPRAGGPSAGLSAVLDPDSPGAVYALHDDPLVGYVLKPESELAILDGRIRTDHLGMRRPPGPPPPDEALRVVVLGDSIAFGFGVGDGETLAARLEESLAALRGPRSRPVSCRTIAMPSWNHRAASAFLLDHWDELRPDLVLYMPVRNDVYDIDGVHASGVRRPAPDPSSRDPWLTVSVRYQLPGLIRGFLAPNGGTLRRGDEGAEALTADISPESRRRHDENAATIARLHALLEARGCRLALLWFTLDDYTWVLSERLREAAPGLPSLALMKGWQDGFSLPTDPHPNARTLEVWGRWLAEALVERGWVSRGEGAALPQAPAEYAAFRAESLTPPADVVRRAAVAREQQRAALLPEIDFRTGRGLLQVFGGLNGDLSARSGFLALLRAGGPEVSIELGPVERTDLYPIGVAVEIAGRPAGRLELGGEGPVRIVLPLPEGVAPGEPFELRLTPERWIVGSAPGALPLPVGARQLMSFRPLRLACAGD